MNLCYTCDALVDFDGLVDLFGWTWALIIIYCDGCDMCGWMCGWMRYICDGWDIYVMDEIYMWWMRYIYVMDEIYMWYMFVWIYLSWWNVKKLKIVVLGHFAECCTRQRTPLPSAMVTALGKARKMGTRKIIFPVLPSAMTMVLGKDFFLKKNSNFAECWLEGTRQRIFFLKKKFKLCQAPTRGHSANNFSKKNKTSLPRDG